jgi:hypothetical protein
MVPNNTFELHIHTSEVSPCAVAPASEVVRRCTEQGYRGLVVTDHFSDSAHHRLGDLSRVPWRARVDYFLEGWRRAKAAAPKRCLVLLGMELRFSDGTENDYLVFGVTEEFLYQNENFQQSSLRHFRTLAQQYGMLIVQAHPFRVGMTITDPALLDGAEIYNGNSHHDSHNDIAAAWVTKFRLLPTSGSDYHGGDTGNGRKPGGATFLVDVQDNRSFLTALQNKQYSLLTE